MYSVISRHLYVIARGVTVLIFLHNFQTPRSNLSSTVLKIASPDYYFIWKTYSNFQACLTADRLAMTIVVLGYQ